MSFSVQYKFITTSESKLNEIHSKYSCHTFIQTKLCRIGYTAWSDGDESSFVLLNLWILISKDSVTDVTKLICIAIRGFPQWRHVKYTLLESRIGMSCSRVFDQIVLFHRINCNQLLLSSFSLMLIRSQQVFDILYIIFSKSNKSETYIWIK